MRKIQKLFPFETERCLIRILNYDDISNYIDKIKQPFFREFMEVNPANSTDAALTTKLISLISSYKIGLIGKSEIRAVIIVDGKLAGGITIFNTEYKGTYDIGYWILPQYQGKGIAYEALAKLTDKIEFNVKGIELVRLIIQEDNYRSIKLAEKAGYEYISAFQGKVKKNLIYGSRPLKFE